MGKTRLVAESIDELYGKGWVSDDTGFKGSKEPEKESGKEYNHDDVVEEIKFQLKDVLYDDGLEDNEKYSEIRQAMGRIEKRAGIEISADDGEKMVDEIMYDVPLNKTNPLMPRASDAQEEPSPSLAPADIKRGKVTYDVLKEMEKAGLKGLRYVDIVKLMHDNAYGEGSYEKSPTARGYNAGMFRGNTVYGQSHGAGPFYKYANKNVEGRYVINGDGRRYIKRFEERLKK
jgi:hypothetical protein